MPPVHVRLYAELVELGGSASNLVPVDGARSVKDVVESLGVPHVEVALLLCDGHPVGFEHRVEGGERLSVLPPLRHLGHDGVPTVTPAPTLPPRFVCDVHLGTLSRRLRLLGFDTRYDRSWDDVALAAIAADEDRILLSRDRGLLKRRAVVHGYLPRSDDPDEQVLEVVRRFDLARQLEPATRCVPCNGRLDPVPLDEVRDEVPPRTRASIGTYARCRDCAQVFWPGSHHEALAPLIDRARRAGPAQ